MSEMQWQSSRSILTRPEAPRPLMRTGSASGKIAPFPPEALGTRM